MSFYRKYKWLLPSLLFSLLFIAGRIVYTDKPMFIFIAWNLFLASIPLYMAHMLQTTIGKVKAMICVCLWLLFFPNSMYIVTDLFHLRERGDVPLWYDLLLLLSSGINGVVMGFYSLHGIEKWMSGFIRRRYLPLIIFLLLFLCGYGVYLGRYERWNSWDIITQPFSLLRDIRYHVVHPFRNINIWALTFSFALWMYLLYKHLPVMYKKK